MVGVVMSCAVPPRRSKPIVHVPCWQSDHSMADLPVTPARVLADYRKGREARRAARLERRASLLDTWVTRIRDHYASKISLTNKPVFQFEVDTKSPAFAGMGVDVPARDDWIAIASVLKAQGWLAVCDKSEPGEPILHFGVPFSLVKEAGLHEASED